MIIFLLLSSFACAQESIIVNSPDSLYELALNQVFLQYKNKSKALKKVALPTVIKDDLDFRIAFYKILKKEFTIRNTFYKTNESFISFIVDDCKKNKTLDGIPNKALYEFLMRNYPRYSNTNKKKVPDFIKDLRACRVSDKTLFTLFKANKWFDLAETEYIVDPIDLFADNYFLTFCNLPWSSNEVRNVIYNDFVQYWMCSSEKSLSNLQILFTIRCFEKAQDPNLLAVVLDKVMFKYPSEIVLKALPAVIEPICSIKPIYVNNLLQRMQNPKYADRKNLKELLESIHDSKT